MTAPSVIVATAALRPPLTLPPYLRRTEAVTAPKDASTTYAHLTTAALWTLARNWVQYAREAKHEPHYRGQRRHVAERIRVARHYAGVAKKRNDTPRRFVQTAGSWTQTPTTTR